jgi:AcrR family transcriptional regulator
MGVCSVPKVSAEHKAAVRQQLVEATSRVMARHEPITTRAITAEADVSAGTLYNYFDSLSEVVAAAGEWFLATEWRQFRPEIDPDGSYGGLMDVLDEFVLSRPPSEDEGIIARLRGRMDMDDEVNASIRRFNGFVADLMAPLVADGVQAGHINDRVDPRALVELLDLLHDALLIRHSQGSFATSFDDVTATLREVLERGALCAPDPSPSATTDPIVPATGKASS